MRALSNSSLLNKLWTFAHAPLDGVQCAFCKPVPKVYRPWS